MWVDERGSDVLGVPECRQLLAIGAAEHRPGHLGIPGDEAPTVLPVDYAVDGTDVVIRVGEGLFDSVVGRLVAFEVEGVDDRPWSVLVRGLALQERPSRLTGAVPSPRVGRPGGRVIRIRSDVITGRRLGLPPESNQGDNLS
jgi:Pyridoxamine 5'-phosphate oxidase